MYAITVGMTIWTNITVLLAEQKIHAVTEKLKMNFALDAVRESIGVRRDEMKTELKPCPFCGRQPTLTERKSYSNKKWYRIICLDSMCLICPSTADFEDKEDAIRAWNRRTEENK